MADHYEVWKDGQLVSSTPIDSGTRTNKITLRERLKIALKANNDFINIPAPTNDQIIAHVQHLTKENSALIRLAIDEIDDISDT